MSEKKKLSKLCFTGFILSVIVPALWFVGTGIAAAMGSSDSMPIFYGIVLILLILLPFVGFILSIIGVATAGKKGEKGRGFGIAGILLPVFYTICVVTFIGLFGALMFGSLKRDQEELKNNELYGMDCGDLHTNTEYDVSQYILPEGYDFSASGITVSAEDLNSYADSRLQSINRVSDERIRGTFAGYEFIIIRSDCFEDWLRDDCTGELSYSVDGYSVINYEATWVKAMYRHRSVCVYMDPSGEFVIVTNCFDHQAVTEFFA